MPLQPWEKKRGERNALKKYYLGKDAPMVFPLSEIPGHGERQTSLAVPTAVLSVLAMHLKSHNERSKVYGDSFACDGPRVQCY